MSVLKLSGVSKIYPSGLLGVNNLEFETKDREFIVVVGGEKSGKSTVLRLVAGLDDVTGGNIFIDGKDVTDVEPKDRDIAMVFRSNTLYPALNVFDNMGFGLKIRKASQTLIEQRVKSAASILGLSDVLFRKPKTLTAMQKQKVAIGRAIVREPKVYLFDEPLSGLDDKLKAELLHVIINLQARMNGTFVYATKNVSEALTVGTRIMVMKNGLLQQFDTPANLYDYPANAYVAFYIGSPTINFINKAKAVEESGEVYAVEGEMKIKLPESVLKRFTQKDEYIGKDKQLIVGIRPEDVKIAKEGIPCKVTKVESSDENYFAECDVNGYPLVVSATEDVKAGDSVFIDLNADRVYLFDKTTRLTLLERDEGYRNTGCKEADYIPLPFDEEEKIVAKPKQTKDKKRK